MHFIEQYALSTGSRIGRPFILPELYPLPFDKYICVHASSYADSRSYDYYQEVLSILSPMLNAARINVVQLGAREDTKLKGCHLALGCSKRQIAYLLQNSLLYLGNDTMSLHFASYFGKKIVYVSSVLYEQNSRPFWSRKEDYRIVEPERNGRKPSFVTREFHKFINEVKPEVVAQNVSEMIGIPIHFPYKTSYIGSKYNPSRTHFQFVPNQVVSAKRGSIPEIRMDYHFDERVLEQQLSMCKCDVVTDRPIRVELLENYYKNINTLFYKICKDDHPDFILEASRTPVRIVLITYLSEEELQDKRINYYDIGLISVQKELDNKVISRLSDKKNLYFVTSKVVASNGGFYHSFKASKQAPRPLALRALIKVEDMDDFFDNIEDMIVFERLD